ncbi:MAG TPA: gfo/Idh/MocA family oxidoreductase, partial [Acidobacteriota bacterium]|nr:gfo/Idh/MocA family oxidoreductase [Acidobacteriota bacterium]
MTETADQKSSRRDFLQGSGSKIVPVTALAGAIHARAYAQQNNTIQVALVGCGGRGTGAAVDALSVRNGPIKLVAMADVFQDRLDTSIESLRGLVREPAPSNPDAPALKAEQVDVPKERQFAGFDGYKHAIDCLRPGDVAIFATPPAFR